MNLRDSPDFYSGGFGQTDRSRRNRRDCRCLAHQGCWKGSTWPRTFPQTHYRYYMKRSYSETWHNLALSRHTQSIPRQKHAYHLSWLSSSCLRMCNDNHPVRPLGCILNRIVERGEAGLPCLRTKRVGLSRLAAFSKYSQGPSETALACCVYPPHQQGPAQYGHWR